MHLATKYILAVICAALLSVQHGHAQVLPEIQSRFNAFQHTAIQEKLYVHTNKNFYLSGEILWFKVYNVDGTNHKPFNLSKVAYIEILDAGNSPVLQSKVALKNGVGNGSVYIPASVSNGHYKLRAYTNWMKNFGPDYFFEKTITLVNAQKSPEAIALTNNNQAYDVQFFPEGGHLVKGLNSKVAFKMTGTNGKGVPHFKGAIVNQKNDTVARFAPLKFGIGNFSFTPVANDVYKAVIKINNQLIVKELPKVDEQGYTMQVVDKGDSWLINMHTAGIPSGNLYAFVHTRQTIKQAENIILNNGAVSFEVNKTKLDDGISHITVFNSNKQPVCERLVFKQPSKNLIITTQANNIVYNTRKKVAVEISTKTQSSNLSSANLSVSVFKLDSLQKMDQEDIASYIWLSSELRGTIESAGYYFENGQQNSEALDNLLLSQGWRKFEWNNVLSGKANIKYIPEYTGHIVAGKLTNTAGTPIKNIVAYLAVPGKRVQLFTSRSDSAGRLLFNTKNFYGLSEVVLQTNTQIDSNYKIQILNPFSEKYSATSLAPFNLAPGTQHALENNSINMQVHNMYAASKLREYDDLEIDSSAFFGKPLNTYLLDTYTRFNTTEEVLREYTSWLTVTKRRGTFKITVFNETKPLDENPLVLYNGIPVFDMNRVFAIDPLKVRKLDVVTSRYYYGAATFDGILSFTNYKDDLAGFEIDPKAVVLDYEGLQLQRKFYAPVYDTEAQYNSRIPDFRNALYWQPNIFTNNEGKSSLSFYTSDQPGQYIGIIQGITPNGEAGSRYFTFEVKK